MEKTMKQAEYRIKDEVINQLRKIVWAQAVEQVKEQIRDKVAYPVIDQVFHANNRIMTKLANQIS